MVVVTVTINKTASVLDGGKITYSDYVNHHAWLV